MNYQNVERRSQTRNDSNKTDNVRDIRPGIQQTPNDLLPQLPTVAVYLATANREMERCFAQAVYRVDVAFFV
jgi:hypothetical protein